MAASTTNRYCDASDVTNFKAWAKDISDALAAFGWQKSGDTGQVDWATIASVPGSGAYVYEIWTPNDTLANFYLKVEYGNNGAANAPQVRISASTTTDGAGVLTGAHTEVLSNQGGVASQGTSTQYPCYVSGGAGRFGALLWRNGPNNCPQAFFVERSVDAIGAYTSEYVTLVFFGYGANYGATQQTLHLTYGPAPLLGGSISVGGLRSCRFPWTGGAGSAFNATIPFDLLAPLVGAWDSPMTAAGAMWGADAAEGGSFAATVYGTSLTYLMSKAEPFSSAFTNTAVGALCMRYD